MPRKWTQAQKEEHSDKFKEIFRQKYLKRKEKEISYEERFQKDNEYMETHRKSLEPDPPDLCVFMCGNKVEINDDLCLPCREAFNSYMAEKMREEQIRKQNSKPLVNN